MDTGLVFTIGHSDRPIGEFIDLLRQNGVECVLDIRTVPKSRRNPQFGRDLLSASLALAGIGYRHQAGLGGLRQLVKDSRNTGWRDPSFRSFADYMQTTGFGQNIETVVELARTRRCALMCAEALPERCHRSLVADALTVRGVPVEHILGGQQRRPHRLTPFAHVEDTRITYPSGESSVEA